METETVRVGELVRGYVQVARAVADVEVVVLINVVVAVKADVIMLAEIIANIVVLIAVIMDVQRNVAVVLQDVGVVRDCVMIAALLIAVMPV